MRSFQEEAPPNFGKYRCIQDGMQYMLQLAQCMTNQRAMLALIGVF